MSNKKLLIILLVLLIPFIVWQAGKMLDLKFIDKITNERNFKSELVEFNKDKVSAIIISPKSHKVQDVFLIKEAGNWNVKVNDNKSQSVDSSRIQDVLNQLAGLKPLRVAANSETRWKEYEVDSTGTRVIVKEGTEVTLDIIMGRFTFKQTQGQGMQQPGITDMETFVRLTNEEETYSVKGFLDGTFNTGIDSWRDKTIVEGQKDSWVSLSFTLPAFGSYQLIKRDSVWEVNGKNADIAAVDAYLSSLTNLSGTKFYDEQEFSALGTPDYILVLENSQGDKIEITGYVKGDMGIIHSSLNPNNVFDGKEGEIFELLFVGKAKFFPDEQEELIQ